jgi:hypothetical protein
MDDRAESRRGAIGADPARDDDGTGDDGRTRALDRADGPGQAALRRVVQLAGGERVLDVLAQDLSGAELTTLLLEVHRRRAVALDPADVLRRYRIDRFVAPGSVSVTGIRRVEDAMTTVLRDGFGIVALAPVLPLGAHSAFAGVDPRNVIATVRGSEVAADPTNGLALEAAVRRRKLLDAAPRSAEPVRLAASQRVTRAQLSGGPVSFAHFQLLGIVTAGRDTGSRSFERQHLAEHLRAAARGLAALGLHDVRIAVTCLDEPSEQILAAVRDEFARDAAIEVVAAPERESGRAYYQQLCFKVYARPVTGGQADRDQDDDPEYLEVGDGGFVDWTAKLLGNNKERLLISGYGIDRLAILSEPRSAT